MDNVLKHTPQKFLFPDMDRVGMGFSKLLRTLFSAQELADIDSKMIVFEVNKKIKDLLIESIPILTEVALDIIPAGLRLKKESPEITNMTCEEAIEYLPLIMEVNSGFFSQLLEAPTKTIENLLLELKQVI